jgi:glycogen synthase
MNFTAKEIQAALKENGIKRTIQEISDFLSSAGFTASTTMEQIVKAFQANESSLTTSQQSQGLATRSGRSKKALQKFEQKLEEVPETNTHNKFLDIGDPAFQAAVNTVAADNFKKAVLFPQAVASRTNELLNDPENRQVWETSLEDAATTIEQMLYGFNPGV